MLYAVIDSKLWKRGVLLQGKGKEAEKRVKKEAEMI